MRSRPPLPIGPRKPSGPGLVFGSFLPGIRGRNGSVSSVGGSGPSGSSGLPWRKLHSAASMPPPKFQTPPPKWRGLTLEAAQWTFTSAQLQEIVSQAIQQSSEGSALRFLRPDVLEGGIADERHRLELQHTDVKAQYKALVRKRWMLMGALAGHVESVETSDVTTAARTVEELAEVLSALDRLADKMHDIVLQMAQLKSLRDVHNTSALAMALRKINGLFVGQMAEKERLQEQIDVLQTERDEAWKHAEDIAQDYDTLNDRMSESVCGGCGDARRSVDALSLSLSLAGSSKLSTRISAVRKSSIRLSQAGLRSRSRSRHRPGRSSSSTLEDTVPPLPRLPVNPSMASAALPAPTGTVHISPTIRFPVLTNPFGSGIGIGAGVSSYATSTITGTGAETTTSAAALALADAQREVYEMLGLSLSPSQASSRPRTMSLGAPDAPPSSLLGSSRPVSESESLLDVRRARVRGSCQLEWGWATRSVIVGDVSPPLSDLYLYPIQLDSFCFVALCHTSPCSRQTLRRSLVTIIIPPTHTTFFIYPHLCTETHPFALLQATSTYYPP